MTIAVGEGERVGTAPAAGSDAPTRGPFARLRAMSRRQAWIGAGIVVVLAASGAATAWSVTRPSASVVEIEVGGELVYYTFPDIVADLKAEGRIRRYAKLGIVVELPDELRPRLEARRPAVLDALNAYLREQRAEDLTGAAGATRVRQALTTIINDALSPGEAKAVLFREFILS